MSDVCFVSVAFGEKYIEQQHRLKESILIFYPDAKLFFYTDEYPEGSRPMHDSLYGFKVHAVRHAVKQGYNKIFWLDTAMIMCDYVDDLLKLGAALGVLAVQDDTMLSRVISDKYLKHIELSREYLDGDNRHLVGGSLYYFDFNHQDTKLIFNKWYKDEADGFFGSQAEEASEQLQGHRADETCMACSLYYHKHFLMDRFVMRYNNDVNSIFIKRHFK